MKIIFTILFWLTLTVATGQSFDEVISSNRYIDCDDVSFNASKIINQLYSNNQIDSIFQFLDYWDSKCRFIESSLWLRDILKIKTNQFETDSISESSIGILIFYRNSVEERDFPPFNIYSYPMFKRQFSFDSLTQAIARTTSSTNLDESLLLDFYSSESPNFEKIKTASSDSRLNQMYNELYHKTLRQPQFHWAFITGIVQNYGNLSLLGVRPNFGAVIGGKQLRHNYDLIFDLRAGPSKEEYAFVYQDSLISGNIYTGMYIGLEYTFDFIHSRKFDIGVSPGFGYDRITALMVDNDYGEDAKFLSSFNKNIGLVLKYKYGKNGGYMGLHFRYNWTNYSNPGGTALDGEYLNVRLTIGSIFDYWRDKSLKNLE